MSAQDAQTLEELVRRKEDKVHMTITMPKDLKKRMQNFCKSKDLMMKDFVIYCIKNILDQYQTIDTITQQTNTTSKQHDVEIQV